MITINFEFKPGDRVYTILNDKVAIMIVHSQEYSATVNKTELGYRIRKVEEVGLIFRNTNQVAKTKEDLLKLL